MYFFDPENQNTYGTVVRVGVSGMLIVKWDEPRKYEDHIQGEFNFEPDDLIHAFNHEGLEIITGEGAAMERLSEKWIETIQENKKLRQEIETLNTRVEAMKNIENCRFGKAGECIYPNAKYKNCLTACDKWDLDTRLLHRTTRKMELSGDKGNNHYEGESMDNLKELLREAKRYYHNTQQWGDESWVKGKSINDLINEELDKKEEEIKNLKEIIKYIDGLAKEGLGKG